MYSQYNRFFPKWNWYLVNSTNSGNLINHCSMNWSQFKDPVSHMCLAGTVVACWFLTQETTGSNLLITNIFVTEFTGKTQLFSVTLSNMQGTGWTIASVFRFKSVWTDIDMKCASLEKFRIVPKLFWYRKQIFLSFYLSWKHFLAPYIVWYCW